jgi:hypothetical protein
MWTSSCPSIQFSSREVLVFHQYIGHYNPETRKWGEKVSGNLDYSDFAGKKEEEGEEELNAENAENAEGKEVKSKKE